MRGNWASPTEYIKRELKMFKYRSQKKKRSEKNKYCDLTKKKIQQMAKRSCIMYNT